MSGVGVKKESEVTYNLEVKYGKTAGYREKTADNMKMEKGI